MRRAVLASALMAVFVALLPLAVAAQGSAAAESALAWIRTQQKDDGSFPGFGPGESADAVLAFAAAGIDPNTVQKGGKSALDFLAAQGDYAKSSTGAAAKLALAALAAGKDPAKLGSLDLIALLDDSYAASSGQYGKDVTGHALALLALRAAGKTPPADAYRRLVGLQLDDGGWSFDGTKETGSDTNTTALALQALVNEAAHRPAVDKALAYLKAQQNKDGGFPYSQTSQYGNASDANSTANVLQALASAGEDLARWTVAGNTPLKALTALQNTSGAFRFQAAQADDNALATYQSVSGLLGKALPIARPVPAPVSGTVVQPTARPTASAGAAVQPTAQPATTPPATMPATGGAEAPALALVMLALFALVSGGLLRRNQG